MTHGRAMENRDHLSAIAHQSLYLYNCDGRNCFLGTTAAAALREMTTYALNHAKLEAESSWAAVAFPVTQDV